jgi:hypothetical protein
MSGDAERNAATFERRRYGKRDDQEAGHPLE